MTKETVVKLHKIKKNEYKLKPPDGGWGYVIALSLAITLSITFMPLVVFGIIFGQFLESLTDEASATGLITGSAVGIQLCSAGLSLNCLPAALCLYPVKWYQKKKLLDVVEDEQEMSLHICLSRKPEIPKNMENFNCNIVQPKGRFTTFLGLW
ncbi:hypothetical protein RN001_004142 [Aquatica leii]|uniref:Uncharacterized protein n=1 Tax=Aquatica leii TaxID=1421715 RepID=A0AAN7PRW5_9COLE|nr:hypothetical protein RN001_004142 [Aquatica leii]